MSNETRGRSKVASAIREVRRRKLVQVPAAKKWGDRVDADGRPIRVVNDANYDWTYTTFYEGSLDGATYEMSDDKKIDYDLLRRRDPILWNDSVLLFESELDDNGCSILRAKIRVMPSCFFCLLRFWVRVDRVLLRVFDTRIFHRFGHDHVVVERTERERSLLPTERPSMFNDPNTFAGSLPLTYSSNRTIRLGRTAVGGK